MNAIKNPVSVGSGLIDSRQKDPMTTRSPATAAYNRRTSGRQKLKAPLPQPGSVVPRLKLTKPRQPISTDLEVDWEEDLRPTPNETKGNEEAAASATAKRRKANTRKSVTAKNNSDQGPQLPLITLKAGIVSAALDNKASVGLGISNGETRGSVTKNIAEMSETSHRKQPKKDGPIANVNKGKQPIDISSGTSVSSGTPSDSIDESRGPFRATTSKVSIMEHRAQSQRQASRGKAVCKRPTIASSSDGDILGSSRPSASKVTILQARAQPKRQTCRAKAPHYKKNSERHGRAKSVGSKLMLALHGAIVSSQAQSTTEDVSLTVLPPIVPIKPVLTEEPLDDQSPAYSPAEEPMRIPEVDRVQDDTKPVEKRKYHANLDPFSELSIVQSHEPKIENAQQTDLTQIWESLSSTHDDSSEFEVGRGLVGDQPSILDYHMEMEHLPGFAALQPNRSLPNTPSQVTNPFPSQEDTSSEASNAEMTAEIQEITTASAQGPEYTHTPESQKPLLTNEALMELDSSPKPPKSVPKTSIVDSNGSPRLMPRQTKNADVPQLDLEDGPNHKEEIRVRDTSLSQYSRSSCDLATEDTYESLVWTKFQRDMFLEYGIETEKLKQTRLDPRPMSVSHPPSLPQEGTADTVDADRASTSSQRTIDDKKAKATASEKCGPIDRPWAHNVPELPQPDIEPQPSTTARDPMEWITALGVAQKNAHDLLHETNSHLSTQLAAEKATITQVLEIYRQGCSQILDDLFKAQEVRMQMYHQQMQYVKGQHAIICEDMVRGLQELDRRVQQGP
ncbi:hypothetical protein PENARI_c041G06584 [Penicillium arizonense]|uniref:Uncharacterized protein n=1 Tax=Penicillium arizonense TaxID=1835702 RepID=A0A1F5L3F1_PENAI|nr:hypothetical protein PENARI_c041G06584 [Penicillium arizonense]OGE47577.1 hypothetical protein PENARI_c041G06584 [Penicillium arizonense]